MGDLLGGFGMMGAAPAMPTITLQGVGTFAGTGDSGGPFYNLQGQQVPNAFAPVQDLFDQYADYNQKLVDFANNPMKAKFPGEFAPSSAPQSGFNQTGPLVNLNNLPGMDSVPAATNVPNIPKADPTTSPLYALGQSLTKSGQQPAPQAPQLNVPQAQRKPFNSSFVQQLLDSIGENYLGRLGG